MSKVLSTAGALLALTLLGCDRSEYKGADDDTHSEVLDSDAAADDTGLAAGGATLSAVIHGPDGEPADGLNIILCSGACLQATTDADGRLLFEDFQAGRDFALHIDAGESGWADLMVVTPIAADENLSLEQAFIMAELGAVTEMTDAPAAELELLDGLWMTIDPSVIILPFLTETLDVAAAEAITFPPLLPVEAPLAVWYLEPYEAHSEVPMPVRIENRWGLEPGDTATLHEASYGDLAWLDAGVVTVSDDGSELVGGAVSHFATLVLSLP